MLPDEEIEKLCHGRIVKAPVYQSSGRDATWPHWMVILNSDAEIAQRDVYRAVVITHNDTIDPLYLVPVSRRVGLTGFFACSWQVTLHLAGITEVGHKLLPPEMATVVQMVRRADADKRQSTQS